MEAIRRKKIKRVGKQITIDLPDDFTAEEVDLILWPSSDENRYPEITPEVNEWRESVVKYYSSMNIDLNGLQFDRDDLYERD